MRTGPGPGVWFLLGALWLATLPLRPLFDPDEGRYAEIPREMAASGDWVTPRLDELKYFEKPPLQYWATATLYSAFGVHDWTARFWATALAFGCIPLVFAFVRSAGGEPAQATLAASLLAINPYFALTGQLNLLDQGFSFFLTVALFAFVLAQLAPRDSAAERNRMLLTWAALALAVLSKGIVALVIAAGAVSIHMVVSRDITPLKRLHALAGVPLFLAVAAPWFWLVQSRNPEFFHFFFVREHFQRFLTNVSEHVEPWWYFVPVLLIALLPFIWNVRHWKPARGGSVAAPQFDVERFLLIWCGVIFVLFSFSHSKLASYVMPIMPALAVLLARVTAAQPSAFRRAAITVAIMLLIAAAGLAVSGWERVGTLSMTAAAWAAVPIVLVAAFAWYVRARAGENLRWPALAMLSVAGYQSLFMCYAAAFPTRSVTALTAQVAPHISAATRLYSVGQFRHSLLFYLERPMRVFEYTGELAFGLEQAGLGPGQRDKQQFLRDWQQESDAIVFLNSGLYVELQSAGMPGRVIAQDAHSIVVSRS